MNSLGEFGLIRAFASRMRAGPYTSLGIGDDSAVMTAPAGDVVAAVDMVIEGRHFRRSWSSGYDVGVKAAARSLADIAAMGAKPTALLAAVALPGNLPASWALDLAAGLAHEADRAKTGIAGGDTASADSVLVSVTALGDLAGAAPVRRSGARPGDVVAVAGTLGHSAAGFALLASGAVSPDAGERAAPAPAAPARDPRLDRLVAAHLRPAPPYEAGPLAARVGATAMIDISDGLIADLGHVAEASGVAIDLPFNALEPFLEPSLAAAAAAASPDVRMPAKTPDPVRSTLLDWVLTGGEDHALAATFPGSISLPPGWRAIGVVREAASRSMAKVTVADRAYGRPGGWEHFR